MLQHLNVVPRNIYISRLNGRTKILDVLMLHVLDWLTNKLATFALLEAHQHTAALADATATSSASAASVG